jgi:hypothetical protein
MRTRSAIGLVAGLAAVLLAGAASAQTAPTARQMELAQRYVAAIRMEKTFDATMDAMLPTLQAGNGKVSGEKFEAIMAAMSEVTKSMVGEMSVRMAPVLAEVFTEQELEELVEFYEGPTGRAVIDKSPQLAVRMAPLMQEMMPRLQTQMAERICKITDCPPSAAQAK